MRYEKYLPKITEEDMRLISEPIDIYGQNIYNGRCVRMGEDGKPQEVCRSFYMKDIISQFTSQRMDYPAMM